MSEEHERQEISRKARNLAFGVAVFISTLGSLGFGIYNNQSSTEINHDMATKNAESIENIEEKYIELLLKNNAAHSLPALPSSLQKVEPPETYSCKCAKIEGDNVDFITCSIAPICDAAAIKGCEAIHKNYQCERNHD